ncbi:EAL domain-containing protein [Marinobacterium marinum]|uniref:EAL domain-containing protein n=1 Tax=Marinobacterium marinum TaxID=2756129 RepID=A0A7W1WXJ6_9GAMM|nr:EAL domain-containing protein [Marinobacterium marinum]MBA4502052.1 EAL domain-containing protein [Marinobacterium marinum]
MNNTPRQQTALKVADICQSSLISVEPGTSLSCAIELMIQHHVGSVLVKEQGQVLGIITRRQIMGMVLTQAGEGLVTRQMPRALPHVSGDLELDELGFELTGMRATHALVFEGSGRCLGIVSQSDVVTHQGLEHDLFPRLLRSVTHFDVVRLSESCTFRHALERMYDANYSAVLVGDEARGWRIMTETDVVRVLTEETDHDVSLKSLGLPELIAVEDDMSLFEVRRWFRRHRFRHIGVRDQAGRVIGLASYADILRSVERDYSYRLRALLNDQSSALEQSRHNLKLIERVVNASREGVVITDARGRILSVNPAFTAITGYSTAEAVGNKPSMLSSGLHDTRFYQLLWSVLALEGCWQGEIWNRRKDGTVYPEWLSITAIKDDHGEVCQYAAIFHDLTEMKRSQAQMQQLSWFDPLTGLANRRLFEDRLRLAYNYCREQQQVMALLALDIDLFKQINDRFGHSGGDRLLEQMATRIETVLAGRGTAARPAGDEFYIILTDTSDESRLTDFLDELTCALAVPFWLGREEVWVLVSMGVAMAPIDADSGEALIRCAEIALQHSKEQGRNTICFFTPEQHGATLSRYRLAGLLHQALDNQEFSLVYQPQVAIDSGDLLGVEALLRWYNPQLGQVSPEVFIPVAEDAGLIEAVGSWVLERAIAEAASWATRGLLLKLSVNFSARQFQRGQVAGQVLELLEQYQLPGEQLVVELTESCFMHSTDATERELVSLRQQGVRVAIDDFGTGYSSLGYIRNMSLDMIKIDRSFISQLDETQTSGRLVKAIIDMAHAMALDVIAEGVETEQDLKVLQRLGCDQAQGYHIARPMSSAELAVWVEGYAAGRGHDIDTPKQ